MTSRIYLTWIAVMGIASLSPHNTSAHDGSTAGQLIPEDDSSRTARTIKFSTGQVTVGRDEGGERVEITGLNGEREAVSWCSYGAYDQFRILFENLKAAAYSGDKRRMAELVSYPLRVNLSGRQSRGVHRLNIRSKADLLRKYPRVFTTAVLKKIEAAEPVAVFCKGDEAMLGDGVVWASSATRQVAVFGVNQ